MSALLKRSLFIATFLQRKMGRIPTCRSLRELTFALRLTPDYASNILKHLIIQVVTNALNAVYNPRAMAHGLREVIFEITVDGITKFLTNLPQLFDVVDRRLVQVIELSDAFDAVYIELVGVEAGLVGKEYRRVISRWFPGVHAKGKLRLREKTMDRW